MAPQKFAATLALIVLSAVCAYYAYKLSDRSLPYDRIFGVAHAVDPAECGVDDKGELLANPGPYDPDRIRIRDCVRQEWTTDRRKMCNVVSTDPVVRRWLIDEKDDVARLPVIKSEQVGGVIPRMSKVFVQPKVSIRPPASWVSYRAKVCVACPLDAFLFRDTINPVQQRFPICIDGLSTEYQVWAAAVR